MQIELDNVTKACGEVAASRDAQRWVGSEHQRGGPLRPGNRVTRNVADFKSTGLSILNPWEWPKEHACGAAVSCLRNTCG